MNTEATYATPPAPDRADSQDVKQQRLAQALRANLARRKSSRRPAADA